MALNSLAVVEEMSEVYRNDLLPTADQVAALSLQFAQPQRLDSAYLSDIGESTHQLIMRLKH